MSAELKNTLNTLAEKHGEVRISPKHGTEYVRIDKTKRIEFLGYLANTMKERGKDRTFFEADSVQDTIAKFLIPEGVTRLWTRNKTREAHSVVIRELERVIARVWPDDISNEAPTYSAPVVTEPRQAVKVPTLCEDVTETPYKKSEVQIDEDFAKLLGVDTDDWK